MFENYSDVVDVATVAKMLQTSKKSVYHMLDAGELNYRKIGRVYRISKLAVIDYMIGKD